MRTKTDILFNIKAAVMSHGKKLKDLAKEMNWEYDKLMRQINRFTPPTIELIRGAGIVIGKWKKDDDRLKEEKRLRQTERSQISSSL